MSKAVYRRYETELQIRYSQPVGADAPIASRSQGAPSGETSTLIPYFTGYDFSETEGIYGTGEAGVTLNINDHNGSAYSKARGWKYITPTEAYCVDIYDDSRGYADIQTVSYIVSQKTETDIRGAYLSEVILDYGSVPDGGRAEDGYWYEFVRMAIPVCANINGICQDISEMYVNQNGAAVPVDEIAFKNGELGGV